MEPTEAEPGTEGGTDRRARLSEAGKYLYSGHTEGENQPRVRQRLVQADIGNMAKRGRKKKSQR